MKYIYLNSYLSLVKWFQNMVKYYEMEHTTYELTIYILHKFIEKNPSIFFENMTCIGFCCFSIAFKYNEGYDNMNITFNTILYNVIDRHTFTLQEFQHFESLIFKTIEFRIPLSYPSIQTYIETIYTNP